MLVIRMGVWRGSVHRLLVAVVDRLVAGRRHVVVRWCRAGVRRAMLWLLRLRWRRMLLLMMGLRRRERTWRILDEVVRGAGGRMRVRKG